MADSSSSSEAKKAALKKAAANKAKSKGAKGMNAYLAQLGPMTPAQRNVEKKKAMNKIEYGG